MSIQLKRSLTSNLNNNHILKQGQIGIEMPSSTNTISNPFKMKIGDGTSRYSVLPYVGDNDSYQYRIGYGYILSKTVPTANSTFNSLFSSGPSITAINTDTLGTGTNNYKYICIQAQAFKYNLTKNTYESLSCNGWAIGTEAAIDSYAFQLRLLDPDGTSVNSGTISGTTKVFQQVNGFNRQYDPDGTITVKATQFVIPWQPWASTYKSSKLQRWIAEIRVFIKIAQPNVSIQFGEQLEIVAPANL